jgi:hypothetical protein
MENFTEKLNINEIFESVINDQSLLDTMDLNHLLDTIENEKNDYLENKTMESIHTEIYEKINELTLNKEKKEDICKKLIGYRYVDEINELHKGKHIRWIRLGSREPVLTNGGILVDIKFTDSGTQCLCKNSMNRFIQYKFDECISFQKLTMDEQLILMAYEYINK